LSSPLPEPDSPPSPSPVESSKQPPTISKLSEWANLPKRDPSNHIKKLVDWYGFNALGPDIIAIKGG